MRSICSACSLRFEADEARCPKCLRKSTVRDANTPARVPAASSLRTARVGLVGTLAGAFVLVAVGVTWLAIEQLVLAATGRMVAGNVVASHMPEVGIGLAHCDVDYRYAIGGVAYRGSAMVAFTCPESSRVDVRVASSAPAISDLGAGLGLVALPGAALVDFGAFAAVIVALQLCFPRSARLRRLAARLGSRYAREGS